MTLLNELKRRNVLRIAAAYVVASWLLIQVAETIFPLFGFDDTPARIVVIVLAIGFIPAMIFAWAFELTPEGLKKESEVDRSQFITPHTGKKLDRMIMVVLALALGYFVFDKFVLDPQREAAMAEQKVAEVEQARQQGRTEGRIESYGDKSIAVLAFDDMSQAGDQVRITAQLIEARSDTHLWSETYDRQLDDVFAIQDEIAARVVEQLKITLLGEVPHVEKTDPEAYALFLKARHLGRLGTAEGYEQSNALHKQALAIDPDYAAAWDGLATNYLYQAEFGPLPFDEAYSRAREATEKTLSIDPDYAPAYANLAWIAMVYGNDLAQAARHFERALQLDPTNIGIIRDAATLLTPSQSIALGEYANARDPVNPVSHIRLGNSYADARRWDEAIASYQTALRLIPGSMFANYAIGTALLYKGEPGAALEAMQQESLEGLRLVGLVMAHFALGDQVASDAVLKELIDKHELQWAYNIAYVLAYRGEVNRAFAWLDKAVEYNDPGLTGVVGQPQFRNIHDDPRWLPFLESNGKSREQLDAIKLEIKLP